MSALKDMHLLWLQIQFLQDVQRGCVESRRSTHSHVAEGLGLLFIKQRR